jgi:hypothetical protein
MRQSSVGAFPLAAVLLLRACVNGAFALWLFAGAPVWLDIFSVGATYALTDGALGLTTVVLLLRRKPIDAPPPLVSMVLGDAVLRGAAGIAILAFPGIPYFPITLVLFYGVLGVWAAIAGVIAMIAWFVSHHHVSEAGQGSQSRTHAFDPPAAAGLIAFILAGYGFAMGPPATAEDLRIAAGAASGALALVFLTAAFGAAGRHGRTAAIPRRARDRAEIVA